MTQRCFLSLLVEPGMVVMRKGSGVHANVPRFQGVVLRTTTHGFLSQPVLLTKTTHKNLVSLQCHAGLPVEFMSIEDCKLPLATWKACMIDIATPGDPKYKAVKNAIALTPKSVMMPLVSLACERGLRCFTLHWLRKLYTHLEVKKEPGERKPQTVEGFVRVIIKHQLPAKSPEEIDKILVARGLELEGLKSDLETIIHDKSELEFVAEEFGDEDFADMVSQHKAAVQRAQTRRAARAAKQAPASSSGSGGPGSASSGSGGSGAVGSSGGSSGSGSAGLKPIKFVAGRGLFQSEARDYKPPGSNLEKELVFGRWILSAPWLSSLSGPGVKRPSISLTFNQAGGGVEGENKSLVHILSIGWNVAECEIVDTKCPWDLNPTVF
jgi:uncharacterized membrane protein YgcG